MSLRQVTNLAYAILTEGRDPAGIAHLDRILNGGQPTDPKKIQQDNRQALASLTAMGLGPGRAG